MASSTRFGGVAGEVAAGFISPLTLFLAAPLAITYGVLALAGGLLHIRTDVLLPVFYLIGLRAIGHAGMLGRKGEFEAGGGIVHTEPGVMGFVARFTLLLLAIAIPAGVIIYALLGRNAQASMEMSIGGVSVKSAMAMLTGVATLVASACAVVIALASDSVAGAFSRERWHWILFARRQDLLVFFIVGAGSMVLLAACLWPVSGLIAALAIKGSVSAATAVGSAAYLLALACAQLLMGRLAGAFVFSDSLPNLATDSAALSSEASAQEQAPVAALVQPQGKPVRLASTQAPSGGFDVFKAIRSLDARAAQDLSGALAEAQRLRTQYPRAAGLIAAQARFELASNNPVAAAATAKEAIRLALQGGMNPVAVDCYLAVRSVRKHLRLEAAEFEQLARALLAKALFDDAAWACVASGAVGGDPVRVQKALASVASEAAHQHQAAVALKYFDYLIRSYPQSPFLEYWQQAAAPLRRASESSSQ